MATFKFFCYICKQHVEVSADNAGDAQQKFHGNGHSDIKVKALKRGLVGA